MFPNEPDVLHHRKYSRQHVIHSRICKPLGDGVFRASNQLLPEQILTLHWLTSSAVQATELQYSGPPHSGIRDTVTRSPPTCWKHAGTQGRWKVLKRRHTAHLLTHETLARQHIQSSIN